MAATQTALSVPKKRLEHSKSNPSSKPFYIRHTCTIPLLIILAFFAAYAINPSESNIVHHFIFLSYKLPSSEDGIQYGKGPWDIAFVFFYTIVLTFTREFIMQELLLPMARFYGIRSRGKQARFMEQAYTAIYFLVLGPAGLYVMSRTSVWYFNTPGMFEAYPHMTHEADFKFYYLFQGAYWTQQWLVLVLGQEKPRSDFYEYIAHHVVTLVLIAASYRYHFTYMGLAVYLTHDISDFFLSMSKTLHYIDSKLLVPWYALQMCTWIYLRNYLNLKFIICLFTDFQNIGPYELNWETQQYKAPLSFGIALVLLSTLQALNIFWLWYILRIAYRMVVYNIAKDDRSEDEDSEIDEMEEEKEKLIEAVKEVEVSTLLKGHAATKRGPNGVTKVTGRKADVLVTKRT